ncbi:uncharacterized protein LOC120432329 [Culex pipiens pallens]|uniref:uncharacterized protein LOC120432329 n=1 Tax=Culex pipiens pallens TaxID=42434 RepID=UPI0019534155|nr:uncharacterized protein LOC120432329 [Culex pipiens pallens]XP_052562255.1 uncharacterized protein LOC120432329 [Culex pipiens pallens]
MDLRSGRYTGHWMTNLGEPAFPTELWELIFGFLPGNAICRLRLVCRRWRDIVGSCPGLLDRLRMTLERIDESENFLMDEDFVVPPLPPVSQVLLDNWDIVSVGWWPEVGLKLREISLFRCTVFMEALLEMVQRSKNLKSLRLRTVWLKANGPFATSFRQEGMRQLTMDSIHYEGLTDLTAIHTFVTIFPRLSDFRLRVPTCFMALVWLIRRLQDTLESFEAIPERVEDSLLPEIVRLQDVLRLKRLSFDARDPFGKEDWEGLYRAQPLLEELVVDVDRSSILSDIAKTTPTIKALSLYLVGSISMSFLSEFPKLRHLEINGYTSDRYDLLPLGEQQTEPIRCPALRTFRLFQMTLVGFFSFFALCPQIESILLDDVKLVHAPSTMTFTNLRHLDVSACFSVKPTLLHIFAHSPLLEHVRLTHMAEIDDELMRVLCQRATRLRKLELDQCVTLSDTSGEYIIEHCAALEELRLYLNRLSPVMMQRLQRTRNIRVWFSYNVQPLEIMEF